MNQVIAGHDVHEDALSDLELLADALHEALTAHRSGAVIGRLDEVALWRAERHARRADAQRLLRTQVTAFPLVVTAEGVPA